MMNPDTPSSYWQFCELVDKQHLMNLSFDKYHRYGQTYFNLLYEFRPEIADQIRGTNLDPFYKETVAHGVHEFVQQAYDGVSS